MPRAWLRAGAYRGCGCGVPLAVVRSRPRRHYRNAVPRPGSGSSIAGSPSPDAIIPGHEQQEEAVVVDFEVRVRFAERILCMNRKLFSAARLNSALAGNS